MEITFKRRPHRVIWIVIRWADDGHYYIVQGFPSYGLAELYILGTLDDDCYTIEKCMY